MKIIIPARLGSKGLPFKNRTLFKYTADSIPKNRRTDVYVTSDDPEILESAKLYGFNIINRPSDYAEDSTSMKSTLLHALNVIESEENEEVIVLYLTYPERTWDDVILAHTYFLNFRSQGLGRSLLCKKECKTHPYLAMYEVGIDGAFGKQIVNHNMYRRQDYPKCFEICHFVIIFESNYINKLNDNLYSNNTIFYQISDVVDVDTKKDLARFHGN